MQIRKIIDKKERKLFNSLSLHPLQSWEWGDFRKQTGVEVVRWGIYDKNVLIEPVSITIHPLPGPFTIGYLPKGFFPTHNQVKVLKEVAREYRCIFIKVEPMVETKGRGEVNKLNKLGFVSGRPLFTKYNFILNLKPTEEELLGKMKSKTRYNIRLAERRGVRVEIDNSDQAFEKYLELTVTTTKRQKFYAHSPEYHRAMWNALRKSKMVHLIKATYKKETLTTWLLFIFNNTLYYPYGASSNKYRNLMASNLVMWEAIRYGKSRKLRQFDMWGALGPSASQKDPWYGFHRFKKSYGARQVEYVGTYDYVAKPILYWIFRVVNSLRWIILRLVK